MNIFVLDAEKPLSEKLNTKKLPAGAKSWKDYFRNLSQDEILDLLLNATEFPTPVFNALMAVCIEKMINDVRSIDEHGYGMFY